MLRAGHGGEFFVQIAQPFERVLKGLFIGIWEFFQELLTEVFVVVEFKSERIGHRGSLVPTARLWTLGSANQTERCP